MDDKVSLKTDDREITIAPFRSASQFTRYKILFFGQCIALVAAVANTANFYLIDYFNVDIPMVELFFVYIILTFLFNDKIRKDSIKDETLQAHERKQFNLPFSKIKISFPWWNYACLSFLDVLANYLTLLSFRYTSLTSASLLGSLTIPAVMLVSWILLSRVFKLPHFVGVILCLVGGLMTVWIDVDSSNVNGPKQSYTGDMIAIFAALLYGVVDSLTEFFMKYIDRTEYLFMIGLFGAFLTALKVAFFENELVHVLVMKTSLMAQLAILGLIIIYIISIVSFYVLVTLFLVYADATLLVLSLQATQFWVIVFSAVSEHNLPNPWFFVAVLMVIVGVFCYELLGGRVYQIQSHAISEEETTLLSSNDK
mmetsp:Transcript_33396/g.38002  ORF Transcript_33396/g.38002 Transcript_33396/m.38002 type:complete len:368 (-) Transcript_33396:50-1153(-)